MIKKTVSIVLLSLCLLAWNSTSHAHYPHDHVLDLELSPSFSHDGTIFSIIYFNLLKSTDGGINWYRQAKGTCSHPLIELAVSPDFSRDKTVFLSCMLGDIYRSQNGGQSWIQVKAGIPGSNKRFIYLAISPHYRTDHTVLVLDLGEIFQTKDQGENWSRVFNNNELNITSVDWSGDIAVFGTDTGELNASANGGSDWKQIGRLPTSQKITCIELPDNFSLQDPFLIGTSKQGILRVTGGGNSFQSVGIDGGLPSYHITALDSFHEGGQTTIYASLLNEALFWSEDNGRTWEKHSSGLLTSRQANIYLQPNFTRISITDKGTVFLGSFCGIFRSSNRKEPWTKVEALYNYILGLDVSPLTDFGYSVSINTYGSGMYSTKDRGKSWMINGRGQILPRLGPIAYSPNYAEDKTVFTGTYNHIIKSTDNGHSWTAISIRPSRWSVEGLRNILVPRVQEAIGKYKLRFLSRFLTSLNIKLKQHNRNILLIVFSPAFSNDYTLFATVSSGGMYKSVDGGSTFSLMKGFPEGDIKSLVISPEYQKDKTLFAYTDAKGLYKTNDGGKTWKPIGIGLDMQNVYLAISPNYGVDNTLYAGGSTGLFRSRDRGEIWKKIRVLSKNANAPVAGLAISPAFATDHQLLVQIQQGDLFLCRDYDNTFEAVPSTSGAMGFEFSHFLGRDVAPLIKFSPNYNDDKTIYAASMSQILRSVDNGKTWIELRTSISRYEAEAHFHQAHSIPVFLEGQWRKKSGKQYSNSQTVNSSTLNDQATLVFVGDGVKWLGTHGPDQGTASVFIDGSFQAKVDQYNKQFSFLNESFSVSGLSYGSHIIKIIVDGTKNSSSSGKRVDIDAFDISR
jgi:photosystem II stability/assembly factor-like uncharacterized protein